MRFLIICFMAVFSFAASAQKDLSLKTRPKVEEVVQLYRSEHASWVGTELLLASKPDQSKIGGYFSYPVPGGENCIFFSRDSATPSGLGNMHVESSFSMPVNVDQTVRPFTGKEAEIYTMRLAAFNLI